jgi:hypothetical protein
VRFRKVTSVSEKTSNVVIDHAGQELTWDVKILERGSKNTNRNKDPLGEENPYVDPFEQLNQYFAQLPPQTQNELFDVYSTIHHILQPHGHHDIQDLRKRIPPLLKKIFTLSPPDKVAYWVSITPTIIFPTNIRVFETLKESAEKGENFGLRNRPAEATYLRKDYWGLVVLVLLGRMLTPIWGRFLGNIDSTVNNHYKEIYALRLATKTALVDTDGYKRLDQYINIYLTPDKFKNSAMEGSVPKEDAPIQTMAILLVRRLAWVDISGRDPQFSLVGRVYSFIEQHLEGADRQYNERVKPKIPDNGVAGSDQENRASVSELIKIREPYPAGDLTLPEACARTPEMFIARMHPEMSGGDWLELGLKAVAPLRRQPPQQFQFTIMQNVCGAECRQRDGAWEVDPKFMDRWDAFFPPRAIDEMNLIEDLNMMAVCAALLTYRGFGDIAALMTATPLRDREGNSIAGSPPPMELSDDNKKALAMHYPYQQRPSGKLRNDNPRTIKSINVAGKLIDEITSSLINYQWILNIPQPWIKMLPDHDGSRRYAVKPNFRNRFAELAISIASRSF